MKYNLSTYFLFPLLRVPPRLFDCSISLPGGKYVSSRYVNTFLWNLDAETEKFSLSVVHKNIMDKDFKSFEDTLESLDNFVDSYDILDSHYGVKVFSLDKMYYADYNSFLIGKYSKFSPMAQDLCQREKVAVTAFSDTIPDIFSQNSELRKYQEEKVGQSLAVGAECWSTPDIKKETINKSTKQALQDGISHYNRKIPLAE